MQKFTEPTILVINSGSSSVKFALYGYAQALPQLWSGSVDRIGLGDSRFNETESIGDQAVGTIPDHEAALRLILKKAARRIRPEALIAVGHRLVHGGTQFVEPTFVDTKLLTGLSRIRSLAPLHLPHNLAGIEAVRKFRPNVPQVACFDTAFHQNLPRNATLTGLPRNFHDAGVRRYGFHGLSYEYIIDTLRHDGVDVDRERIIVAHLGNGASMCAVAAGRSVETTMGFTALAGLPMGTRCGDLDPGAIFYLVNVMGIPLRDVETLLYEKSGLLGISGRSRSMKDLLDRGDDPAAREAVEYFCHQARKYIGALASVMGGVDRLIFTGGIGTNAPLIRSSICIGLEFLGITVDGERNAEGPGVISPAEAEVPVHALATDEASVVARHVRRLLNSTGDRR